MHQILFGENKTINPTFNPIAFSERYIHMGPEHRSWLCYDETNEIRKKTF
jgi:hypothetical protein